VAVVVEVRGQEFDLVLCDLHLGDMLRGARALGLRRRRVGSVVDREHRRPQGPAEPAG
jgi:hypothetical protein